MKTYSNQKTLNVNKGLSFKLINNLGVFLINKLGWTLRKSIRYTVFGSFDSLAGAIVGGFTWAFGISIFIWLTTSIGIKFPEKETQNTYLYPFVKPLAPKIIEKAIDVVPKQINKWRA